MDRILLISSLSNPLIKKIRSLKSRKSRREHGLFLVEGLHHIGSMLEAGWDVDTLLYAPDLASGKYARTILENARSIGLRPQPVSVKVIGSLAGKDNPQGILAVVKQRRYSFSDLDDIKCGVGLVSPQDPGNLGTILRTIDAVSAEALFILDGGVDHYHPTCVRSSMGTLFWKPVIRAGFVDFISWVKSRNIRLVGASAHGDVDYWDAGAVDSYWMLLLGSEQKGLSSEQQAACDVVVSLPMRGRVSSLNLSVAAGVLLYALKG